MTQRCATQFFADETGAVTVDWVVLTAALVGLGLAVMTVISGGLEDLSGDVGDELGRDDIIRTSFTAAYSAFDPDNYDNVLSFVLTGVFDGNVNDIPDEWEVRGTFAANVSSAEQAMADGNRELAEYYIDSAEGFAEGARQRDIEIIGGDDAMSGLRAQYDSTDFPAT